MKKKYKEGETMPYVFTYSLVPAHKIQKSAELYLEEMKDARSATRPLAKEIIPNAVKATIDGIETISVYDIKEGKLEEFLKTQQKLMVAYHAIEGFKYNFEVRFKVTEALEMVGMKMPE